MVESTVLWSLGVLHGKHCMAFLSDIELSCSSNSSHRWR